MELEIADPLVEAYVREHTTHDSELLAAVADETERTLADSRMLSGPAVGRLLSTLAFATGARRVLEIGTYTGYSALSIAEGLGADGRIVTLEFDPDNAAVAQRHFDASPLGDRIELRTGPALETISELDGPFDLVFIDADKREYLQYLHAVLPLLSERGLVAVDNTLWSGRVVPSPGADDAPPDDDTRALMEFNDAVVVDPRLSCVLLTVRDGLTLIHKRPGTPGNLWEK